LAFRKVVRFDPIKFLPCGHFFPDANFCSHCGTKAIDKTKKIYACSVCGQEISEYDNFCHNCGARIEY